MTQKEIKIAVVADMVITAIARADLYDISVEELKEVMPHSLAEDFMALVAKWGDA